MVISKIYIKNIQSIQKPLILELDKELTRIDGRNTAGKSAIVKALSLFAGVYSRSQITGLVSWNRPEGENSEVHVLFENGSTLSAKIGNTSSVYYSYEDANKSKPMKYWDKWEPEIGNIMGFTVVEKENLCLNIKKSKVNLLIDTSPTSNAIIVDHYCRNETMENIIENLEEGAKQIAEAKKQSQSRLERYQPEIGSQNFLSVQSLDEIKDNTESIRRLIFKGKLLDMIRRREEEEKTINKAREISNLVNKMNKNKDEINKVIKYIEDKNKRNNLLNENDKFHLLKQLVLIYKFSQIKKVVLFDKIKKDKMNDISKDVNMLNKLTINRNLLGKVEQLKSLDNSIYDEKMKLEKNMIFSREVVKLNEVRSLISMGNNIEKIKKEKEDVRVCNDIRALQTELKNLKNLRNYISANRNLKLEINKVDSFRKISELGNRNIVYDGLLKVLTTKNKEIKNKKDLLEVSRILEEYAVVKSIKNLTKAKVYERDINKELYLIEIALENTKTCPMCNSTVSHSQIRIKR